MIAGCHRIWSNIKFVSSAEHFNKTGYLHVKPKMENIYDYWIQINIFPGELCSVHNTKETFHLRKFLCVSEVPTESQDNGATEILQILSVETNR